MHHERQVLKIARFSVPPLCPICWQMTSNDQKRREVKTAFHLDVHGLSLVRGSSSVPLSRWRHGFESRWGCHKSAKRAPQCSAPLRGVSHLPRVTFWRATAR